jgi:hypothetical protein
VAQRRSSAHLVPRDRQFALYLCPERVPFLNVNPRAEDAARFSDMLLECRNILLAETMMLEQGARVRLLQFFDRPQNEFAQPHSKVALVR